MLPTLRLLLLLPSLVTTTPLILTPRTIVSFLTRRDLSSSSSPSPEPNAVGVSGGDSAEEGRLTQRLDHDGGGEGGDRLRREGEKKKKGENGRNGRTDTEIKRNGKLDRVNERCQTGVSGAQIRGSQDRKGLAQHALVNDKTAKEGIGVLRKRCEATAAVAIAEDASFRTVVILRLKFLFY